MKWRLKPTGITGVPWATATAGVLKANSNITIMNHAWLNLIRHLNRNKIKPAPNSSQINLMQYGTNSASKLK